MERGFANTLRTFGIIGTATLVGSGCLYLVGVSRWHSSGGFAGVPDFTAATNEMFGAVALGFFGTAFIAWLAHGIFLSLQDRHPVPLASSVLTTRDTASQPTPLARLSSGDRSAVDRLVWCLAFQLAVSALDCIYSVLQYQQVFRGIPNWYRSFVPFLVLATVIFAAPYAVLLYLVRQRLSRIVVGFAVALPAVSILQSLITNIRLIDVFTRNPVGLAMLAAPLIVDTAIIVLASQVGRRTGRHASASWIATAALVSFIYFYALRLMIPIVRAIAMKSAYSR